MKNENYKGFALFLYERSEIIYMVPVIPAVLNLVISLATAAVYNLEGANYLLCKNKAPANEELDRYLSGTIIINYIFLLIYCNILMEFIMQLAHITISFVLLMMYLIISIIWNALGIKWLQSSKCTETKYFILSQVNIIIGFSCILIFLGLSFLKILLAKNQKVQPIEETQNLEKKNEEKAEEKGGQEDNKEEELNQRENEEELDLNGGEVDLNGGEKEENLDDLLNELNINKK